MTIAGTDSPPGVSEAEVPPLLPKLIYYTLRVGVAAAGILLLLGLVLLLLGPTSNFGMSVISGAPFSVSGMLRGVLLGRAVDLLALGFLVLIATPLTRVVLSVVSLAAARDRAFTALTISVLVLLAVSALVGAYT